MQKFGQKFSANKGHTVFIFDNQYREQMRFTDLIRRPPEWSDDYYGRDAKQLALDQVVDVPYYGDSRGIGLIQVADFVSYLMRRYAELKDQCGRAAYDNTELAKVSKWVMKLTKCSIGRS